MNEINYITLKRHGWTDKTVPQLKKIFREMLFDKIENDKFFELKCLYHDPKSKNEKYAKNYIKGMNKQFELFRVEWCTKIKQCGTIEELSLLAKEMDNLYGEHFSDYL